MKLVKIKNIKNSKKILTELNSKIDILDWKLAEENSYVIVEENGDVIPAYITLGDHDYALTLWVDKKYRGKGYGKFLVESLGVKYAVVLYSSVPFWESIGFVKIGGNIFKKNDS
jgi:GNAT superfamily N-acetyltransferase